MSFQQEDINEFKIEALEFLDIAEKSLLSLDKGEDFSKAYDIIFRSFHNLKGGAGMMEMLDLQKHIHELETAFVDFKTRKDMKKSEIDFFLTGIDTARAILNQDNAATTEQKNSTSEDVKNNPALDEYFNECQEICLRFTNGIEALEKNQASAEVINSLYRDMHSLKGAAFLFGYKALGDLAHAIESFLESYRGGANNLKKSHADLLFNSLDAIEKEISEQKQGGAGKAQLASTKKIISELSSENTGVENHPTAHATVENNLETVKAHQVSDTDSSQPTELQAKQENSLKDNDASGSIRVSVALLDKLMTLTGEMVLIRNQVMQFSNKIENTDFVNMSKRLSLVTSEVQSEMMKTRMQPIGNVINKYSRVVRDLSGELKKSINLSITGAETEIDKSLLEAVRDPITHIVRNACDHGIETPEERKSKSKPASGLIEIKSYHEGGQVIIEVKDDGRGLNRNKLIKKAIQKQIITEAESRTLSDKEVFSFIFYPGFSTAESVTNVSGRGVGMDVVKTNIEKIGGSLDLSSEIDRGTTIQMKIPLTLAIIPALVIKSAENYFAIPQVKLIELIRVGDDSKNKIEKLHNSSVFRLRGSLLPLVELNEVLEMSQHKSANNNEKTIAVLNAEDITFGLVVDEVCDTADIVVKPLNNLLKSLQIYSGATVLGDGSISLILDVQGLAKIGLTKNGYSSEQKNQKAEQHNALESNLQRQDYLLVELNSTTKHGIVLEFIKRIEKFDKKQIEYSGKQPVIRYRDSILPIISLNSFLEYNNNREENDLTVVVIEKAGKTYGLEVNSIIDSLSTDIGVESLVVPYKGIVGQLNTKEELIVVLDVFEIISKSMNIENAKHDFKLASKQPVSSKNHAEKLKLLLVEDTTFFRNLVASSLTKFGFEVVTAKHGQDALDILNDTNTPFNLIVSDIEMPYLNGFELAMAVRKHGLYKEIPMIAFSSRADEAFVSKGRSAGFNMYLEKQKPEELAKAILYLVSEFKGVA